MWGYPHALSHEGLRAINEFAEAEHTEMVILMWETATMTVLKRQGQNQTMGGSTNYKNFYPGEEETVMQRTQHHCGSKIAVKVYQSTVRGT